MASTTSNPQKRGPGRPRQSAEPRQHIDITLSREVLAQISQVTTNRSQFIEEAVIFYLKVKRASGMQD